MRRVTELDAIRGLAALSVLIFHLNPAVFLFQGIRVDLFLVLSGYLVTTIILNKGGADNFYLVFQTRRILRIWPLYYLTLTVLVVVNTCLAPTAIAGLPNYLTFTQNIQRYWSDSVPPFKWYYTHTWSLALEQQFYLFWPLLVGLLGRGRLVPLALWLVVQSVASRALGFHWWLLLARCDGFALGSILAVWFVDRERVEALRDIYRRRFGLGLGIALAFLVATLPFSLSLHFDSAMSLGPSLTVLGFNLVYFSLIGLVLCDAGHPALRVLRDRRLVNLGKVSYGLYVFHPLVFLSVSRLSRFAGLDEAWWLIPIKLAASIALATLSWRYVERPILALRDCFEYGSIRPVRSTTRPGALHGADA